MSESHGYFGLAEDASAEERSQAQESMSDTMDRIMRKAADPD